MHHLAGLFFGAGKLLLSAPPGPPAPGTAPGWGGATLRFSTLPPPGVLLRSSITMYQGFVWNRSATGAGSVGISRLRLKGPWKRILPFLSSSRSSNSGLPFSLVLVVNSQV